MDAGNYEMARRHFDYVIGLNPDYPEVIEKQAQVAADHQCHGDANPRTHGHPDPGGYPHTGPARRRGNARPGPGLPQE